MRSNNYLWNMFGSATGMGHESISVSEAINKCHADFDVALQPIIGVTPELLDMINGGDFINASMLRSMIIDGSKTTMRMDNHNNLGIVSDSYGIVQYRDAFNFVDMLTTGELGSEKANITACGVLNGGRKCVMVAKFPEPIVIDKAKDDTIDMYIVLTTSHDGTGGVRVACTPIRVWCTNMLNLAFRECSGKMSFRHTRFVGERLDLTNQENASMAYKTLGIYTEYKKTFEAKLQELASIKVTDKEAENILAKTLLTPEVYKAYKADGINSEDVPTRSKNIMFGAIDALTSGVGQEALEGGTGLWLVNGLTTYYQNSFKWTNDEKKFEAISDGSVANKLNNAYSMLLSA